MSRRWRAAGMAVGALALVAGACGSSQARATQGPATATTSPTTTRHLPDPCPSRLTIHEDGTIAIPAPRHGSDAARGTDRRPVPTGAVAARLCRYSGLDDEPSASRPSQPGHLLRAWALSALTDPRGGGDTRDGETATATVDRLVDQLDAGGRWPSGRISCPADDDADDLVILLYSDGSQLQVDVHDSGCATVYTRDHGGLQVSPQLDALLTQAVGRSSL